MFLTAGYIHFIAFRLLPLRTFPQPFSHSISAVQTFSSAVRPHPFKNFPQPFDLICSQVVFSRSAVQCNRFEWFLDPFLIRSLAVRSTIRTDTVRNVFTWEVTYFVCFNESRVGNDRKLFGVWRHAKIPVNGCTNCLQGRLLVKLTVLYSYACIKTF